MKKNIAMRVAAFLFILTMISTCAFATTFAKYTTSKSADDTARVAKWGVEVAVTGKTAFSKWYKNTAITDENDTSITVSGAEEVVAPGTEGTLFTLNISGTPEVDTKVTIDFSMELTGWVVGGNDYCPLEFTVNTGSAIKKVNSVSELISTLEAAVEGTQTEVSGKKVGLYTYDANHSFNDSITVTWKWAFEGNDDVKDTALGTAAATGTAPRITFNIDCTVEQVD